MAQEAKVVSSPSTTSPRGSYSAAAKLDASAPSRPSQWKTLFGETSTSSPYELDKCIVAKSATLRVSVRGRLQSPGECGPVLSALRESHESFKSVLDPNMSQLISFEWQRESGFYDFTLKEDGARILDTHFKSKLARHNTLHAWVVDNPDETSVTFTLSWLRQNWTRSSSFPPGSVAYSMKYTAIHRPAQSDVVSEITAAFKAKGLAVHSITHLLWKTTSPRGEHWLGPSGIVRIVASCTDSTASPPTDFPVKSSSADFPHPTTARVVDGKQPSRPHKKLPSEQAKGQEPSQETPKTVVDPPVRVTPSSPPLNVKPRTRVTPSLNVEPRTRVTPSFNKEPRTRVTPSLDKEPRTRVAPRREPPLRGQTLRTFTPRMRVYPCKALGALTPLERALYATGQLRDVHTVDIARTPSAILSSQSSRAVSLSTSSPPPVPYPE